LYDQSELNAVERLSAQEALGDNDDFEQIHARLSKRESLRKSLSSPQMNIESASDGIHRNDKKDEEKEKIETIAGSGRRMPGQENPSSPQFNDERRRRRSYRRRSSRNDGPDDDSRLARSASDIEKLLEYTDASNFSTTSNESGTEKKSKNSMNPLLIGLSKSRDSTSMGRKGRRRSEKRTSKSRERHRSSSKRDKSRSTRKSKSRARSTSKTKFEDSKQSSQPERVRVRRRRSASSQQSEGKNETKRNFRGTKSLRATRSFMSHQELKKDQGFPQGAFERLWGTSARKDDLNQTTTSHQSNSSSGSDNGQKSTSPKDLSVGILSPGTPGKVKKTKLEKIHELQGKCDFYKIKLDSMTEEQRKYLRELEDSREEASSLKRIVEVHEEQSTTLKLKLAESQNELELIRTEQQTERTKLSNAAKELTRVNIEYAKSVDTGRIERGKLDDLQKELSERERKISALEKDLETSNENSRQLEADVLYADDQIGKLEAEIKKLENEVALYAEAADRDSLQTDDGTNHLRDAKNEADKRRFEEREKEVEERRMLLEEKSRTLDEDMKEFERQRTQHFQEQQLKEKEFEDRDARAKKERYIEDEKCMLSDKDRFKEEEEMKKHVAMLEDENTALNGRLKSEQLESTMKLKNKENDIFELQTEVARLAKLQKERDSAPDSSSSLISEIDNLKTEATRRNSDFEDVNMKKIELQDQVEDLHNVNSEVKNRLSNLEAEIAENKKEVENQRRKCLEWQKKTGEMSEKAVMWKQKSEFWEKKARETSNDSASSTSDDAGQVEPQALFLAAAVQQKAANTSAVNTNGSWRLGRRIFGMSLDSEDEAQALVNRLEAENSLKEIEIKTLKSEMVKMQTNFKEQAYGKTQGYEKLKKEMEAIELRNANLLKELDLARKLNRTISESAI